MQARNALSKNWKSIGKDILKDGAKGVGYGIVGSGIDTISDGYEDEMYSSNLRYLLELMIKNMKSIGISVISNR